MSEVQDAIINKANILTERNVQQIRKIRIALANLTRYYQKLICEGHTHDIQHARSVGRAIQQLRALETTVVTNHLEIQRRIKSKIQSVFSYQNTHVDREQRPVPSRCDEDRTETCNVIYRKYLLPDEDKVTFFVDNTVCKRCQLGMLYQASASLCVCPACGNSKQLIHFDSSEPIEFKGRKRKNTYNRVPLFSKFVKQFSKTLDPLDPKTLAGLLKHIRNKHSSPLKLAKPTPIANFLRSERLGSLMHCALRICKALNGEKIPLFEDDLIDRLCDRFAILTAVLKDMDLKDKKKIMNFEYITKQFLLMENEIELASCFLNHKTREIVVEADLRFFLCCEHINRLLDMYEEKHGITQKQRGICMMQTVCGQPHRPTPVTWHNVAKEWYENGFQGTLRKGFRSKLEKSFQIFNKTLSSLEDVDEEVYTVLSRHSWIPKRTC